MYGRRLKELRLEKGFTQKQLAELLHTTQKSISKYEIEFLDLNTDLIIRICEILHTTADYLLGLTDENDYETTIQKSVNFNSTIHNNYGIINNQYKPNK